MKVALLMAIKDDDDIVFNNLLYYYNIGIRDFYIILHCASMEVEDEINRFRLLKPVRLTTIEDNDYTYKKDFHFNYMSQLAFNDGCDWHIATDADELLILREHNNIYKFLQDFSHYDFISLRFKWYNYREVTYDNPDENNVFLKWRYREFEPSEWSKAIAKWGNNTVNGNSVSKMEWVAGQHHHINCNELRVPDSIAYYAHFPLRSKQQWIQRKIDFAKTKRDRFGDDPGWMEQSFYYEIMNDPEFLENRWREIRLGVIGFEETYVFDPLNPQLFKI